MPSILIAYPVDHASLIVADKLAMEIGNEITFFIDPKIDNEFMVDAANDLQCVMDKKVNIIKHQDWTLYDYVVIASLNIFPSNTDKVYADNVHKLFRMHLTDVKWNENVNVVLGQNYRGLIASREIIKVHPSLKGSVFVFSSIYSASIEVNKLLV